MNRDGFLSADPLQKNFWQSSVHFLYVALMGAPCLSRDAVPTSYRDA